MRSDILWIIKEAKTSFCGVVCSFQNSKDCLSIILVTEDATERQIATLLRILKQMSNEIPNDLVRLSEVTIKGREQDKQNKLCSHLKAFGKCMYAKHQSFHKVTVVWH